MRLESRIAWHFCEAAHAVTWIQENAKLIECYAESNGVENAIYKAVRAGRTNAGAVGQVRCCLDTIIPIQTFYHPCRLYDRGQGLESFKFAMQMPSRGQPTRLSRIKCGPDDST